MSLLSENGSPSEEISKFGQKMKMVNKWDWNTGIDKNQRESNI